MKKNLTLVQRIKRMKIGQHFHVATKGEQQNACRAAKVLKQAGIIEFDVVTKRDGEQWKVAAI